MAFFLKVLCPFRKGREKLVYNCREFEPMPTHPHAPNPKQTLLDWKRDGHIFRLNTKIQAEEDVDYINQRAANFL